MPFGMVNGVGRGTGVLDGGGDRRRKGEVVGHPIVTNGDFTAILLLLLLQDEQFGDKCGASHCNHWGLYGVVALFLP